MSIRDNYQQQLSQKLRYFANWFPNRPIKIGDVGVLNRKHFEPEYNLRKSNPEAFKVRTSDNPFNINFYSEGSAKIEFMGDVKLQDPTSPVKSNHLIKIKFDKAKSVFFEARSAKISRVEHFNILQHQLVGFYKENQWSLDSVLITEIVEIEACTIIVTNKAHAEVILKSENEINPADKDLITVKSSLSIQDSSSTEVCMVNEKMIIPLFKISKLKKKWQNDNIIWDKKLYSKDENEYELVTINADSNLE